MSNKTECGNCGHALDEVAGLPSEDRNPCPNCGSLARKFGIHLKATAVGRTSMRAKGKEEGRKKPFAEVRSEQSLSRKLGRFMNLSRLINRRENLYHETVEDPETGEIIHECKEPLSEHIGHGSAKEKK